MVKATGVKRETFNAVVRFDHLHAFKLDIDGDEYALLHYHVQRKKFDNQFNVQGRARIVETKWPEKDGRKAHSSFMLQVYVNDNLKWERDITRSNFMNAM